MPHWNKVFCPTERLCAKTSRDAAIVNDDCTPTRILICSSNSNVTQNYSLSFFFGPRSGFCFGCRLGSGFGSALGVGIGFGLGSILGFG